MLDWLKRQRSSRGFGIHSPFAYNFVVNVLREKYHYYAYKELPDYDHRLIYRIALSLAPSQVCATTLPPSVMATLPSRARERKEAGYPLYIVTKDTPFNPEAISAPYAALFLDMDSAMRRDLLTLREQLDGYGMIFSNPSRAVVVADPDLPRQDFSINF